jgi:hypothetical protein
VHGFVLEYSTQASHLCTFADADEQGLNNFLDKFPQARLSVPGTSGAHWTPRVSEGIEVFLAGQKGYGVRVTRGMREGEIIGEYMGEVLSKLLQHDHDRCLLINMVFVLPMHIYIYIYIYTHTHTHTCIYIILLLKSAPDTLLAHVTQQETKKRVSAGQAMTLLE